MTGAASAAGVGAGHQPGVPYGAELFRPRLARRRMLGRLFAGACAVLSLVSLAILGVLLYEVFRVGWPALTWGFLTGVPSVLTPEKSGIFTALIGSLWTIAITALSAIPLGIGAAIYLEEYAPRNRLTAAISLNIANLAGVPSIVYGILGLALFVRWMEFDRSVLSGGLTLSLLVLPVIIIVSREALSAVPDSIRQAAYALGATRWQTVRHHVLPAAIPGMMTGIILALSRAIGEAAPLIMIGALAYVTTVPGAYFEDYDRSLSGVWTWLTDALTSHFSAMPIQIYNWTDAPQQAFHVLAAAGIIVLLGVLLSLNAVAVGIRAWQQARKTW